MILCMLWDLPLPWYISKIFMIVPFFLSCKKYFYQFLRFKKLLRFSLSMRIFLKLLVLTHVSMGVIITSVFTKCILWYVSCQKRTTDDLEWNTNWSINFSINSSINRPIKLTMGLIAEWVWEREERIGGKLKNVGVDIAIVCLWLCVYKSMWELWECFFFCVCVCVCAFVITPNRGGWPVSHQWIGETHPTVELHGL